MAMVLQVLSMVAAASVVVQAIPVTFLGGQAKKSGRKDDAKVPELAPVGMLAQAGAASGTVSFSKPRASSLYDVQVPRKGSDHIPTLADGCHHVFLDLGSNQGVHVRQLFEAEAYQHGVFAQMLAPYFGPLIPQPANISTLCAFAFEGNPRFVERHHALEKAYKAHGWNVVFLTPAVVWTKNGTMQFHVDKDGSSRGSSVIDRAHKDAAGSGRSFTEKSVPAIDFAEFVQTQIVGRRSPVGTEPGKVFMKMDIEGAEFDVIPQMVKAGLFCKGRIDAAIIELHARIRELPDSANDELLRSISGQKLCQPTEATSKDDETFLHDPVPLP